MVAFTALVASAFALAGLASASPTPELSKRVLNVDDADRRISYNGGGWTALTNQAREIVYQGTEHYSNNQCASYSFTQEAGDQFRIYVGKKKDRGFFDVWVGDYYYGSGDAYDAGCTSQCPSSVVFTGYVVAADAGSKRITIRNRVYDSRIGGTPFLDLDRIEWVSSNA